MISILTLFFTGCVATTTTTTAKIWDYSDFTAITVSDTALQLEMADGTYYLYYYGPNCMHCEQIKQQVLSEIAVMTETKIYLVAVNSTADIESGVDVTETPSLVKVVDHSVAQVFAGTTDVLAELASLH